VFWNPWLRNGPKNNVLFLTLQPIKQSHARATHLTSFSLGVTKPQTSVNNGKNEADDDDDDNTLPLVLITVGSILGFFLIVAGVLYLVYKKKKATLKIGDSHEKEYLTSKQNI